MNLTLLGMIVVFAAYALNRFVMTDAAKKLADEDKVKLFEVFSKRNNYSTILVLGLVIIYFAALQYLPHFIIQITAIYLAVYCVYLVFRFVSNYRKLREMQMPANYIKSFIISYGVFMTGVLIMAFCIFWNWNV